MEVHSEFTFGMFPWDRYYGIKGKLNRNDKPYTMLFGKH